METLEEAKAYVQKNAKEGVECPCCDQHVKSYRRKLNSIMAAGLISLYEQRRDQPIHISQIKIGDREVTSMGGSFALLWHWGLIWYEENEISGKRCSGLWSISQKGIDFVLNRNKIRESALFYNNQVIKWYPEQVNIIDCLGTKYDYEELLVFHQESLL